MCEVCQMEYEGRDETVALLPCGHFFHSDCVSRWLKVRATCPKCRCELKCKAGEEGRTAPGPSSPRWIEGRAPLPAPRIQMTNGEWVDAAPMYIPIVQGAGAAPQGQQQQQAGGGAQPPDDTPAPPSELHGFVYAGHIVLPGSPASAPAS
uniref:RING-type domain-containing protein n=1 Tax=Hemiselmis andersenii TaxID=464988 RepID=A0A7S0XVX4_HEMAN